MVAEVEPGYRQKLGRFIRSKREALGLTQEEVALRSGLSPSLIAKLEQGRQDLLRMQTANLLSLLRVLNISPSELADMLSVELQELVQAYTPSASPAKIRMVPILGEATAGKPYEYPIPAELHRPNTAVFFVSGDSMDDGTEDAIKDGDMVLVDTSLTRLRPGGLYVLEILGDGYTIKEARKLNGEWVFIPWNPNHPPLRPDEVRVVGEVYVVNRFRKVRR